MGDWDLGFAFRVKVVLDLVLAKPQRLLLVEVKARRRWGLDHGGLLACGPRKRCRLARALRC